MGWIAALIWSFTNPSTVVERDSNSAADEIAKLATLKDQGVLTEKEFNDKKRQILDRV